MKIINKKTLWVTTLALGLSGLLITTASQAGWWWHGRYWRWQATRVKVRGPKRIVIKRFCSRGPGGRECFRERHVFWRHHPIVYRYNIRVY